MDLRATETKLRRNRSRLNLPELLSRPAIAGQAAFTLMEVLVAVLILAGSLMTLLGMQTTIIERTIRDRNQRQAMLIARSILAAIEIDPESIETQETTVDADKLLRTLTMQAERDDEASEILQDFQARLLVDTLEIPIKEDQLIIMKQVLLTLFWGEENDEKLDVVFFMPLELGDLADLEDEDVEEEDL